MIQDTFHDDPRGFWIPLHIWSDRRLTITERVILAKLPELIMGGGRFRPGKFWLPRNSSCVRVLQVSQPTFTAALKKFNELGLIKTKFNGTLREVVGGSLLQPNETDMYDFRIAEMKYEGEKRLLAQARAGSFMWAYLIPHGTDPSTITPEVVREKGSRIDI